MSYLAVAWPGQCAPPIWIEALIASLPKTWSAQMATSNIFVARGGLAPPVRALGGGVLIGEVFGQVGALDQRSGDASTRARRLCDQTWGSYVALLPGEADLPSVFRDPSGGLDCLVWRRGEALRIADELPAWLDPWRPSELAIDWSLVAAMLCDPVCASADVALTGVDGVAPGLLWSPKGSVDAIWTPAKAARRRSASRTQAMADQPRVVDEVVGAMAGERSLIELSGGLDSAIVASALRAGGKTAEAINYFSPELGGDERAYARAVARLNGIDLTEVEKPAPSLDLAALAAAAGGARPGLNALDAEHDLDVAQRCIGAQADSLLTGQGGDHVFFQAPSALIAADAFGQDLDVRMLQVLARRLGRSAWSVLGEAIGARLAGATVRSKPAHLTGRAWSQALEARSHPWLEDLAGLPPAKRLQAASLAAALSLQGASRRGAASRLRHPLLSQPVMEYCLPIPVADLTLGGHDRALARSAFRSRLPGCVADRQGKGRLTSHYGRAIASGLAGLRPLLLEGRLAQEGLLDLQALDPMLTREHLAWKGGYGAIMGVTALELWVRAWEARIAKPRQLQRASLEASAELERR